MKYLFFDTNIYLDMLVSREENNTVDYFEQLEKILNYNKVKIILPNIVKSEVKRNLVNEIENIGRKIKLLRANFKTTYWINHISEIDKFNNRLKPIKSEIGKIDDEFEKSKDKFLEIAEEKINRLFSHQNVIEVEENDILLLNIQQRKIYKKCPFHIDGKDSFADALIIEILENLGNFIEFGEEDKLYFLTRNYKDFSNSSKEKDIIHRDIKSKLEKNKLFNNFNYRNNFNRTLIQDFKEEINEVDTELLDEIKAEEDFFYKSLMNEERESVGLTNLDSDYIEKISDDDDMISFIHKIEEILSAYYSNLEEYIIEYEDFFTTLENTEKESFKDEIEEFNQKFEDIKILMNNEDYSLEALVDSLEKSFINFDTANFTFNHSHVLDYFPFSDEIFFEFFDFNKNKYFISVQGKISPSNFGSDTIDILLKKNNEIIERGLIELFYGGIEFNEDGGITDGSTESIDFYLEKVKNKIFEIVKPLDELVTKNRNTIHFFEKILIR